MKRLGSRVGNAIMMRMSHAKHERTRDGSKYDDNDTNEDGAVSSSGGAGFAGLRLAGHSGRCCNRGATFSAELVAFHREVATLSAKWHATPPTQG